MAWLNMFLTIAYKRAIQTTKALIITVYFMFVYDQFLFMEGIDKEVHREVIPSNYKEVVRC